MLILKEINFALDAVDGKFFAYPLDENACPILLERILISSLDYKQVISQFGAFTMALVPQSKHVCHVCGNHYTTKSRRSDTCSDSCRKQKSRIKRDLTMLGVDDLFINEFRLHMQNLNSNGITFSMEYLNAKMKGFEETVQKLSPKALKYLILSNQ